MVLTDSIKDNKSCFNLLRMSHILCGVGDDQVLQLANITKIRNFVKGERIYNGNINQDYINIVASGRVQILLVSPSGKQFVIGIRNIGETFFDIYTKDEIVYDIAEAIDDTTLLSIPWKDFVPFIVNNEIVIRNIMQILSTRVKIAYRKIIDLVSDSTFKRVSRTLLGLSSAYGSTLPFSGRQIADMSGTTPETTSRIINILKSKGLVIDCKKNLISIDISKFQDLIYDNQDFI